MDKIDHKATQTVVIDAKTQRKDTNRAEKELVYSRAYDKNRNVESPVVNVHYSHNHIFNPYAEPVQPPNYTARPNSPKISQPHPFPERKVNPSKVERPNSPSVKKQEPRSITPRKQENPPMEKEHHQDYSNTANTNQPKKLNDIDAAARYISIGVATYPSRRFVTPPHTRNPITQVSGTDSSKHGLRVSQGRGWSTETEKEWSHNTRKPLGWDHGNIITSPPQSYIFAAPEKEKEIPQKIQKRAVSAGSDAHLARGVPLSGMDERLQSYILRKHMERISRQWR